MPEPPKDDPETDDILVDVDIEIRDSFDSDSYEGLNMNAQPGPSRNTMETGDWNGNTFFK